MGRNRFLGTVGLSVGVIVFWVGVLMWRATNLDWAEFKQSGGEVVGWVTGEIYRLTQNPLGVLGIIVASAGMIVGLVSFRLLRAAGKSAGRHEAGHRSSGARAKAR